MAIIMECLDLFIASLGKKISLQKSSIYFSQGIADTVASGISALANIPRTTNLEKYFGTSSLTGRVHLGLFQPLLDRIGNRLEG